MKSQSTIHLNNFRPSLLQLEGREVPATFSVSLNSPQGGEYGSSAASYSGGISLNPNLPVHFGKTVVEATDELSALESALTNSVSAHLGGQTATYTPSVSSIGPSVSSHQPFALTPTATQGVYELRLEDLAQMPGTTPDWDYDDRIWVVTIAKLQAVSVVGLTSGEEIADGSHPVQFEVYRNASTDLLNQPLTVSYTLSGDATPGTDYVTPSALSVQFAPGQTRTTITLPVLTDTFTEDPETVIVTLQSSVGTDPIIAVSSLFVYDPNQRPPIVAPPATVALSAKSTELLINANDHNYKPANPNNFDQGRWKSDSQAYIPKKRDFDAINLWQPDPDLVELTINLGPLAGQLDLSMYNPGEGVISFWVDREKSGRFSGMPIPAALPGNPNRTITVFMEGDYISASIGDVFARAVFTPQGNPNGAVEDQIALTVGPVVQSFTSSKDAVHFVNGVDGRAGLEGGVDKGPGNAANKRGVEFDASVGTNFGLNMGFTQNLLDVKNKSNGAAAGTVDTVAANNKNLLPNQNRAFPLLDSNNPQNPAYNLIEFTAGAVFSIKMFDTPLLGPPANQGNSINTYDVRHYFKAYLWVQFPDSTLYTLGTVTWDLNFYATRSANAANPWADTIDPASGFTVSIDRYDHSDPALTVGNIANGNVSWQ